MSIPTPSRYIEREAKATAWLIHLVMWRTKSAVGEANRIAMACSTDHERLRGEQTTGDSAA
jgi:hypothetical protein